MSLTGNATAHANAQDIANLTVTFANGDFTGGNAGSVTNATKNDLVVDFADPAPVKSLAYSASSFVEAVANDGSITTTSTITLSNDTFTGSAVCPVPGLVWMAMPGHGLYVYAIKGALRPDQQTQLYQAPFFNVWGRGRVCIGSAFLPTEEKKWSSEAWEQTFFGSRFTHPNFSEKNRLIQGASPTKFWKGMVGKPAEAFPEQKLVQMPLMVADLLDRMLLDTLAKLPKPKGEF